LDGCNVEGYWEDAVAGNQLGSPENLAHQLISDFKKIVIAFFYNTFTEDEYRTQYLLLYRNFLILISVLCT
jgi:hypothetical protein